MQAVLSILIAGVDEQSLLTAYALKRLGVAEEVRLLRLPRTTAADVSGESVPPFFAQYLTQALGIPATDLHGLSPVPTLGTKYRWGRRGEFYQSYDASFGMREPGGEIDPGYLAAREGLDAATPGVALMAAGRLPGQGEAQAGMTLAPGALEPLLVRACQAAGVQMLEGELAIVERDPQGVSALRLTDGRALGADLFVDMTGQAALLRQPGAGFFDYDADSTFCTHALTLRRRRGAEPVKVHATVRDSPGGFTWRLEHAGSIGLGFAWQPGLWGGDPVQTLVHKSWTLLDGPVFHRWRPGRQAQPWQGNVLAMGDAAAFLEPLASSRSAYLILQIEWLRKVMPDHGGLPGPAARQLYGTGMNRAWDEMRDLTALYYRYRSPQGQPPAEQPSLGGHEELLAMYRSIGPSTQLGACLAYAPGVVSLDAWLAALLNLGVEFPETEVPATALERWRQRTAAHRQMAARGRTWKGG